MTQLEGAALQAAHPGRVTVKRETAKGIFGGLAVLTALIVAAGMAIRWMVAQVTDLPPELGAAMTAGVAAVVASAISLSVGRYFERRSQIENHLRTQRVPLYEDFIGSWFRYMYRDREGAQPMTDQELFQFFQRATVQFSVWGSDEVVSRWSKWRRMHADPSSPPDSEAVLLDFAGLILAMRKDLGQDGKNLTEKELLGLFINDI